MKGDNIIKKVIIFCKIFILVSIVVGFSTSAMAVNSIWTDSPPEITGAYDPTEWNSTEILTFSVNNTQDGGDPVVGTMVIMNDKNNLYIKIECDIPTTSFTATDSFVLVSFDNTNNQDFNSPEDIIIYSGWLGGGFGDGYVDSGGVHEDTSNGGTNDGTGSYTTYGSNATPVWRLSHPLNSGDSLDFGRTPGDDIGYTIQISLVHDGVPGYTSSITYYPANPVIYPDYGEIILATPPTINSGWAVSPPPPILGGNFNPADWNSSGSESFTVDLPWGGTTEGTMYAMNDGFYLYIAIAINTPLSSIDGCYVQIYFDNNNNGSEDDGEDVLELFYSSGSVMGFDLHINTTSSHVTDDAPDEDIRVDYDTFSSDSQSVFILAHHLDDPDPSDAKDFSLAPGDTVGFTFSLRLSYDDGSVTLNSTTLYPTTPRGTTLGDYSDYGDIVLATNCQNLGGDSDGDGICSDLDTCPNNYNPVPYQNLDTDGDLIVDACDNCPYVSNPYIGDPEHQPDSDGDGIGNACDGYNISSETIAPSGTITVAAGAPIWDEICIKNTSTEPITIFRPDCFNVRTWWWEGSTLVVPRDRHGKAYGIPKDLITLPAPTEENDPASQYCITCDLSETVVPEKLTTGTTYNVEHWYSNWFTDPWIEEGKCAEDPEGICHDLWIGWMKTGLMEMEVIINGSIESVEANISFNPDHWDLAWATENSPTISATISTANHLINENSLPTNILLNGDVGITGGPEIGANNTFYVQFDRSEAVQSLLNSAVPGASLFVTIQGELSDGNLFSGKGRVDIVEDTGTLVVKADLHRVGAGTYPGSEKESIVGMPVKVFDKSQGSCAAGYGISWQNYQDIWINCDASSDPPMPIATATTDGWGQATFALPPGDYLVIGEYSVDGSEPIYIGRSVGEIVPKSIVDKYLQVIEKANKGKVPAKYRKFTGSELLVIEPEYIEWDSESELYPIIFDSIGDWSVTTSVEPPEGFVADNDSLSATVNSDVEAIQFTITDIGSKWVSTKVKHKIKHKNKVKKFESSIGIKLTPSLAKKKGLSIYGKEGKKDKDKKE